MIVVKPQVAVQTYLTSVMEYVIGYIFLYKSLVF